MNLFNRDRSLESRVSDLEDEARKQQLDKLRPGWRADIQSTDYRDWLFRQTTEFILFVRNSRNVDNTVIVIDAYRAAMGIEGKKGVSS